MEYGIILLAAWLFFCIGVAVTLSAWIVYDKHRFRRIRMMVTRDDSWCVKNCKQYEDCFSRYKDVYRAAKALGEWCDDCPMAMAMTEWTDKEGR